MSATPTPWKFVPWHIEEGPSAVRAPEGWLLATTSSDDDAALIVKAVNAYQPMLEALKEACRQLEYMDERSPSGTTPAVIARVKTAITLATGGEA